MADEWREEIAARLRALQQALGDVTDDEMGEYAGLGPDRGGTWWTYIRSDEVPRKFPVDAALALETRWGVTIKWIYTGLEANRNDPELQKKIDYALANPKPRSRGRRSKNKK